MKRFRSLILSACFIGSAWAQRVGVPTDELANVGVDELFSVQVTSVGRKAQELSKAPAAIFVLTAEDIRRSGATSIPEALQWVPGLTVLRIDGRSWSISARGSSRQYANKILVMIDGRSLYTPLFSGVIWDAVDTPLEDIERIEVVRGPGAVMWGPNAVNGVINIITKRAQATTGLLTSTSTGNELKGAGTARWGAAPSDRLAYRIWGKADYETPGFSSPGYFLIDGLVLNRDPSVDKLDRTAARAGFRVDGQPDEKDRWMVQGDMYKSLRQDPAAYAILLPARVDRVQGQTDYLGGYVQGLWTRSASTGNESTLQFSYSHDDLDYPFIDAATNNLTADFENRRQTGERNEIYWGGGYQQYWDNTTSQRLISFNPQSYVFRDGNAVIRDEWQFVPNRLVGSAGMRLDYTSYGHLEYQPSLRLLYTPNAKQSVWLSASRALRLPSRFDRDLELQGGNILVPGLPLPAAVTREGSKTIGSEVERSLESGYRLQSGQRWSVDVSVFLSFYSRLVALERPPVPFLVLSGPSPTFSFPTVAANPGAGTADGGEIWGTWQVRHGWRLMPSYSYIREIWRLPPTSASRIYFWQPTPSSVPHQAQFRSQHDLSKAWKLDLMARIRSRNTAFNSPAAFLADARVSWKPSASMELSFSVKDLTDREVVESYPEGPTPAIPTRRTFVLNWTYRP